MQLLVQVVRFLLNLLIQSLKAYLRKGFKNFSTNKAVKKLLKINGVDYDKVFKQEFKKAWNQQLSKFKSKNEIKKNIQKIFDFAEKTATEKVLSMISSTKNSEKRIREIVNKISSLSKSEKKQLEKMNRNQKLSNQLFWAFNSSWIIWGLWVPYKGTRRNQGFLTLQLKTKSKRNPASIYTWKNIWRNTALRLSAKGRETGTNFWRVFYHQNRKNRYHLLKSSKYWLSGHYSKSKGI